MSHRRSAEPPIHDILPRNRAERVSQHEHVYHRVDYSQRSLKEGRNNQVKSFETRHHRLLQS